MAPPHSTRWLSDQARIGLRELPSNAAWLLSRVQRQTARKLTTSSEDAAPAVETRMKRARAAAERAQETEDEALEAARAAKESADHARQLAERNRAWLADVEREAKRRADERVAEAQRAAEEQVEQERVAAQREHDEEREKAHAEAAEATEDAEGEADAAQQRAYELLAESRQRLEEARRLADEAEEAARAAAEEAHRQAQQLAEEAEQLPKTANATLAADEQARTEAHASATGAAADRHGDQGNGNLEAQTKAELDDLAAAMGIEGHTKMSKAELVSAITKAAPTAR